MTEDPLPILSPNPKERTLAGEKRAAALSSKIIPDISIRDDGWHQTVPPIKALIREVMKEVLKNPEAWAHFKVAAIPRISVGFCLADNAFVAGLNRKFRGKDKPTNALSFPSGEVFDGTFHLGDITLALGIVGEEAKDRNKPVLEHTTHLLVHALLHLLGFKHDGEEEAAEMEGLETRIMARFGFGDPYIIPDIIHGAD